MCNTSVSCNWCTWTCYTETASIEVAEYFNCIWIFYSWQNTKINLLYYCRQVYFQGNFTWFGECTWQIGLTSVHVCVFKSGTIILEYVHWDVYYASALFLIYLLKEKVWDSVNGGHLATILCPVAWCLYPQLLLLQVLTFQR